MENLNRLAIEKNLLGAVQVSVGGQHAEGQRGRVVGLRTAHPVEHVFMSNDARGGALSDLRREIAAYDSPSRFG
jgi:hypothetical protein